MFCWVGDVGFCVLRTLWLSAFNRGCGLGFGDGGALVKFMVLGRFCTAVRGSRCGGTRGQRFLEKSSAKTST